MNKRQKEVLQTQLNNEKAVLKQLESNYEDALAEINGKIETLLARQDADMAHVIYQVQYQRALKTQVQSILENLQTNEFETISEYLAKSYEGGFLGTMYDLHGQNIPLIFPIDQEQVVAAIQHETNLSESLYTSLGKDITDLRKKISGEISRGISTGMMYSEIARNVASYAGISKNNAMRITRTEAHRIQERATMDAHVKAKSKGADIVKVWSAALDSRTRDSHRDVDGEIREVEETFSNGLLYPGDPSGKPEEVINCRCRCNSKARWLLGSDYTKWSEDAPIVYSDDGTTQLAIIEAKNYEDFQKKYKQATEQVRSSVQKTNQEYIDKFESVVGRKPNENELHYTDDDFDAYFLFGKFPAVEKGAMENFSAMSISDLKQYANSKLVTNVEGLEGVKLQYAQETLDVLSKFESKAGGSLNGLTVHFGDVRDNAFAHYDSETNTLFLKKNGNLEAKQTADNEKALKKLGQVQHATTTYSGTIWHELGHAMDFDTGQNLSRIISNDSDLMKKSFKISGYASAQPAYGSPRASEAFAENVAAYMDGGANAKDVPQEIVDMIERYFSGKRNGF